METPAFQQLAGLCLAVKTALRADTYLTGSEEGQLGYTADQVCKTVYQHKMFVEAQDGIVPLMSWGNPNLPALAIYVEGTEYASDVHGSAGAECELGFQFVFPARAKDVATHAFAVNFANAIWWKIIEIICGNIQTEGGSLRNTYHIEDIGLGRMRLLDPFTEGVRAFTADGSMSFKRPPWDTGADSSQVVDLASIYTDFNEKGETGADPLVQGIYEVPEE